MRREWETVRGEFLNKVKKNNEEWEYELITMREKYEKDAN